MIAASFDFFIKVSLTTIEVFSNIFVNSENNMFLDLENESYE